ncbi:MAG: hypothetical protein ACRD2B_04720 [Terriglobia bacterium]
MRNRSEAAKKAWKTIRNRRAWIRAHAAEAGSKAAASKAHFEESGWRVAFFEGKAGAPRTGIIDAVIFRLSPNKKDVLDLRLVQLKAGKAGVSAAEIGRLKRAAADVAVSWIIAEFDRKALYLLPNEPET